MKKAASTISAANDDAANETKGKFNSTGTHPSNCEREREFLPLLFLFSIVFKNSAGVEKLNRLNSEGRRRRRVTRSALSGLNEAIGVYSLSHLHQCSQWWRRAAVANPTETVCTPTAAASPKWCGTKRNCLSRWVLGRTA